MKINGHRHIAYGPPQYTLRADAARGEVIAFGPNLDSILDAAEELRQDGRHVYVYDEDGVVLRWLAREPG